MADFLSQDETSLLTYLVEDSTDSESSSDDYDDLSDSSNENGILLFKPQRVLHRFKDLVENNMRHYDEREFKSHFRINWTTCYKLIDQVKKANVLPTHTFGRKKINAKKAVLMTVWYLANTVTFRELSISFDVSKSAAHKTVKRIIEHLVTNSKKVVKWPGPKRKEIIRREFRQRSGMNGIIGAIDCCHINIQKPVGDDKQVYCNRKSQYSILLQAVCDHETRFIDVFSGEGGSIHDAHLLEKSGLYERGTSGFFENDYILGDSAYPCLDWLITPFNKGSLTHNQRKFNSKHYSTRKIIEDACGLLKGRFRRLKAFQNEDIKFIVDCVIAAAVLHNICIDCNDDISCELENADQEDYDEETVCNISDISPVTSKRTEIFKDMFKDP